MNSDLDELRESVLQAVKEVYARFEQFRQEATEKQKSVTVALGMLSKDLLDFIDKDVAERRKRQRRQDIKDAAIGCFLLLTILTACGIISVQVYLLSR